MDFTKKRLQQELEDKMEVEQQSRRQLERRVRLARGPEPVPRGLGLSAMPVGIQARDRQALRATGKWCVSRS